MRRSQALYLGGVYFFLYLPIIIMVVFSFNDSSHSLLFKGFTVNWFLQLFNDKSLITTCANSLLLAVSTALCASVLGVLVALAIQHYRIAWSGFWRLILLLLILLPDLLLALAMLSLFRTMGFAFGFWSLLIAHTAFSMPFVYMIVSAALNKLDPELPNAAADLGASQCQGFFWVLLPLLRPAVAMGAILSFALSLDDVVISYFVSGPNFQILPLRIYALARMGANPEVNALCSLLFVITLILVFCFHRLKQRGEKICDYS